MSHFTVLVIGEDPEAQLEPFNEQPSEGSPLLEFTDCTEEVKHKYENEMIDCVKIRADAQNPEGRWVSKYSAAGRGAKIGAEMSKPAKEVYKTITEYAENWFGYRLSGSSWGYWSNPNAKWDWYELGGRWRGFLKLKAVPTLDAVVGEPGMFDNEAREGFVDQCRKGEVDFDKMREQAKAEAIETYDRFEAATQGLEDRAISWGNTRRVFDDAEQARKVYWDNPWVKAVKEAGFGSWGTDFYEQFFVGNGGREAYVKHAINAAFQTYAVLYEGTWYQRGEMGWFGFSDEEMTPEQWDEQFNELLDSLPDDTLLSLYDCHI